MLPHAGPLPARQPAQPLHPGGLGLLAMRRGEHERAGRSLGESAELFGALGDPVGVGQALRRLAGLAAESGRPERAARLLGTTAVMRDGPGATFASAANVDPEVVDARVRPALGEQRFAVAWAEGRAMTLEQAVAYGLEQQLPA
jgi:hypothetical protein